MQKGSGGYRHDFFGIGATIGIGREMLCLPYAGFFFIGRGLLDFWNNPRVNTHPMYDFHIEDLSVTAYLFTKIIAIGSGRLCKTNGCCICNKYLHTKSMGYLCSNLS